MMSVSNATPQPAPAVVRRGRGTFGGSLHSSTPASSANAALPSSDHHAAGERFAFAFEKPTKPIDITGAELQASESARVQLFRKERRKRYTVLVGPIDRMAADGICKLFGHRGPKPLRLHQKWIRLLHIALPVEQRTGESAAEERAGGTTTDDTVAQPSDQTEVDVTAPATLDTPPPLLQPLTVGGAQPTHSDHRLAFPVLTTRYFKHLAGQFSNELAELWKLEDIAKQRTTVQLNFGTVYVCANNNSRTLQEATFLELIEKWNDESLQLYFINDCPPCVSRAVDSSCAMFHTLGSRNYSVVKLTFFSRDKQTRSIARALWNGEQEAFELVDIESIGVTFNWTIFSVDDEGCSEGVAHPPKEEATPETDAAVRKKTVAFPVDLSFRAYYRSKNMSVHNASGTARLVLEKLTEAEHDIIRHGHSSHQYETMDLSSVCELDAKNADNKLESIQIEHCEQRKLRNGLLIESSTCLLIEGFDKEDDSRRDGASGRYRNYTGDDGSDRGAVRSSGLSFFRTRTNMIHWKVDSEKSVEKNLEGLNNAFAFVGDVMRKANRISSQDARGGAAPEAI